MGKRTGAPCASNTPSAERVERDFERQFRREWERQRALDRRLRTRVRTAIACGVWSYWDLRLVRQLADADLKAAARWLRVRRAARLRDALAVGVAKPERLLETFAGDVARLLRESVERLEASERDGHRALNLVLKTTTAREVARRCGVSEMAVSRWRNGTRRPCTTQRRVLHEAYGIAPGSWEVSAA